MKKLSFILAMLLVLLAFVSCGNAVRSTQDTQNETAPADETATIPDTADDEDYANGGTPVCLVHREYYHMYDYALVEFVGGEEVIEEWFEKNIQTEEEIGRGCPLHDDLYRFIHDFNISREDFASIMSVQEEKMYNCDINMDVLFADDESVADEYYRNVEDNREEIYYKKSNFCNLKSWLYFDNTERFKAIYPNYGNGEDYGVVEAVIKLGYTREELEALVAKATKPIDGIVAATYDYNYDFIFETDRAELEKLMSEHTPYYIDCIFRNVEPTEHPFY